MEIRVGLAHQPRETIPAAGSRIQFYHNAGFSGLPTSDPNGAYSEACHHFQEAAARVIHDASLKKPI